MTSPTTSARTTGDRTEQPDVPIVSAGDTLTVLAWRDLTVEQAPGAMATDSDDALVWYTPSVGTIGMAMAHRFARHAHDGPSTWTIEDIARTFGIGPSPARVLRSLDRLERFGIIRRIGDAVHVRLWLAPLTFRQRCQLPAYLAAAYEAQR
ncbi:MAG: hypothetical protein AB7H92_03730 [Microbacteriaceae bacterium]